MLAFLRVPDDLAFGHGLNDNRDPRSVNLCAHRLRSLARQFFPDIKTCSAFASMETSRQDRQDAGSGWQRPESKQSYHALISVSENCNIIRCFLATRAETVEVETTRQPGRLCRSCVSHRRTASRPCMSGVPHLAVKARCAAQPLETVHQPFPTSGVRHGLSPTQTGFQSLRDTGCLEGNLLYFEPMKKFFREASST